MNFTTQPVPGVMLQMSKCHFLHNVQKYKNKNSPAPAISTKKQNKVKTQKPKDTKKCKNARKS